MNINMIKVFIADDHPIVTTGIKALLSHTTSKELVNFTHSGKDLIQLLSQQPVDVLLLDLNMPGDNFRQLIPAIRKRFRSLKIIIYTTYSGMALVKTTFKLGIDGYVLKDNPPTELLEAIDTVCQGHCFMGEGVEVSEAYAKSDVSPNPNALVDGFQKKQSLSKREQEIFELICQGYTGQNIGLTLHISKHTVETHRKNILRKLDVSSSVELIRFAVRQGLA